MTDLASWLLAQIADDEAAARAVKPLLLDHSTASGGGQRFAHSRISFAAEDGYPYRESDPEAQAHFARHDPARVLAECAAKRKLLSFIDEMAQHVRAPNGEEPFALTWMRWALAEPYADRPGFDPVWKLP